MGERTLWTFHPIFPQQYANANVADRVLLVAAEPNGDNDGPANDDMGEWFCLATDPPDGQRLFWNQHGKSFCQRSVQIAERARAAIHPGHQPLQVHQAFQALEPGPWPQNLEEQLHATRFVDWKAEAGGNGAVTARVLAWATEAAHAPLVQALFTPTPGIMVFLGDHAQKVAAAYRAPLLGSVPALAGTPCVGLPHPIQAVSMASLAGLDLSQQLRSYGDVDAPMRRWTPAKGWHDATW